MQQSERTHLVLVGDRVAHSRSPAIHNALAAGYGLPLAYGLRATQPDELSAALNELRSGPYRGANITTPHKEQVCSLLDTLDPEAERIGAVNTVIVEPGGSLRGANTDIAGIAFVLRQEPATLRSYTAAVIGTGGAARAAVEALLASSTLGALTLYSRNAERARSIAERWSDDRVRGEAISSFSPVDIVIHATPVGMGDSNTAALEVESLRGTNVLVEMIYAPQTTELMRRAAVAGVRSVGGMAMLVGQALESFRLWTEITPRLDDLPENLLEELRACSVLWR